MRYIIFLLLTLNCFASTELVLNFNAKNVKQGELVQANIQIKGYSGSLKLNGATVADTIYFYKTSPIIRNSNNESMEAEAKVIFLKVPEKNEVSGLIHNQEVKVTWNDLNIQPVEAPDSFLFGEFEIPKHLNNMLVAIGAFLIFGLFIFIRRFLKKRKLQKEKSLEIKKLKSQLIEASDYSDIIQVWQRKHVYIQVFPKLEQDFLTLEQTLFKYVFKPNVSDVEKQIVTSSYLEFKNKIGEKTSGV